MIKRRAFFIVPVLVAGIFLFLGIASATDNLEVVISEIQFDSIDGTGGTEDDWVELYNPTNSPIDLASWSIQKTNSSGGSHYRKELTGIIPAHGFFLVVRNNANTKLELKDLADIPASGSAFSLSENNTVYLVNNNEDISNGDDSNIVDKVGFGLADNFESLPAIQPNSGQSLERKPGGELGNSQDTNNNNNDFFIQSNPNPHNSSSPIQPPANNPPTASAGDDKQITLGEAVSFDGSSSTDSDGTIVDYFWNFGDGESGSGVNVNYTYNATGSFTVTLEVSDDDGATSTDNLTVEVTSTTTTPAIINPHDLVINEFVSDPLTGEKEWIELYNNTTTTLNLGGLSLEDGVGVIANLTGAISAYGFYVQELSTNKLNNDGDQIILKSGATVIDQVSYGSWDDGNLSDNASIANDPNSVARKINGQDTDIDNNDFSSTTTPTKNSANLITGNPPVNPPATSTNSTGGGASQPTIISFNRSDIVINEFVSDPADGEVEWVELYNNTSNIIDLKDWLIEDGSNKKTELSGSINSHQFKIFESPKGNLNNSGDLIVLKDPSAKIIDQVAYGAFDDGNLFDNAPLASDPDATARSVDGQNTNINYNDFKITVVPTKGRPNIISDDSISTTTQIILKANQTTTTTKEFAKIIITEILANPVGSDMEEEFIEIYNPNNQEVDLTNWSLDDIEGGSRPYKIMGPIIESHEYLSFFRKDTGLALNNDTDRARLVNPLGEIVSEVEYKNIKEGLSYVLDNNQWQLTSSPTPGEENEIETDQIKSETASNPNKLVKIIGTVLVEPGILGAQIFYITDENIQVYSYKKDFPQVSVGDVVEVSGELSDGTGERRIKTKNKNDIKIIGHKNELLPLEIPISDIGESYQGQLVKIVGEVIEIKGSYVFIDDGTDEAKIYLKQSTGIDKSLFKEGEKIEIVGIVSKSGSDYRILPRYETDILVLGEVRGESAQGGQAKEIYGNNKYFIAIIIFMGLIISWLVYQQYGYKLK